MTSIMVRLIEIFVRLIQGSNGSFFLVSLSLPSKLDNTVRYMVVGFITFFVLMSTIPWFTNYVVFCSILFFFVGKIYRYTINVHDKKN